AIARVLANEAEVVLMDEPFGALDARTRERLEEGPLEPWGGPGLTGLFRTRAIGGAVFPADPVVVMSPSPGRIDTVADIALARRGDASSPAVNDTRRMRSSQLHSHHGRVAAWGSGLLRPSRPCPAHPRRGGREDPAHAAANTHDRT
ncbi:hypothetical protein MKK58_01975, partial [Methylobacterium sp. J-078]|nr:hypothetical protein [Methylobacterium sp. J-078]